MTKSKLEEQLAYMVHCVGLPEPKTQYRLPETPDRRYAWDFAFVNERLLVDVQGGTWMPKGGHNTGGAIERDCEKMVLGVLSGYRVMFVTALQVRDGRAVQWIDRALRSDVLVAQDSEI
jgi:hypothetical protein